MEIQLMRFKLVFIFAAMAFLPFLLSAKSYLVFPAQEKSAALKPMAGFTSFKTADGILTFEQSRPYSWTASISAGFKAEDYPFLEIRLRTNLSESHNAVGLYFAIPSEPKFVEKRRILYRFRPTADQWTRIRIPLKNPEWRGEIKFFRLDFSGKKGQRWDIGEIRFCDSTEMPFLNSTLNETDSSGQPVGWIPEKGCCFDTGKLGIQGIPEKFRAWQSESRYDLLPQKHYVLSAYAPIIPENGMLRVQAVFLNDDEEITGTCQQDFQKTDGNILRQLRFMIPSNTTQTRFSFGYRGTGKVVWHNFRLQDETFLFPQSKWQAHWLAHPQHRNTIGHVYFQKRFQLNSEPVDGRIQLTGDDAMVFYVNGHEIIRRSSNWQTLLVQDITSFLKKGENHISVRLTNYSGPTGLIANAVVYLKNGRKVELNTDKSWMVSDRFSENWFKTTPLSGEVPAYEQGIPPVTPWHGVAYQDFQRRRQINVSANRLRNNSGKLCGSLVLSSPEADISAGLPVIIQNGDFILRKLELPLVRSGKNLLQTGEIRLCFADYQLPPGNYSLRFNPEKIISATPEHSLLDFTIPAPSGSSVSRQLKAAVSFENGAGALKFNDRLFFPGGCYPRTPKDLQEAAQMHGFQLFIVSSGVEVSRGLTEARLWLGPEQYDFSYAERKLENILKISPDAKIIVSYGLDAPKWWLEKNPGECVRLAEAAAAAKISSPASLRWREESGRAFRAFLRHFESSRFAASIVGYRICMHCDGGEFQYFGGWERKHADYSPAMTVYFRNYLRSKYGNVENLRKAWNRPGLNFENAPLPTSAERSSSEFMIFRDLDRYRNVADYVECHSDAMASAAIHFLKIVRQEAPHKLSGLYGGYVFYYSGMPLLNNGHLAFGKIYRSGLADFITSPHDYIQRKVGYPGGNHGPASGTALHRILYIDENDTRTFLCAPGSHRHVNNLHETLGVLKRDYIAQITRGLGFYYYGLTEGWLSHPEIGKTMRTLNKIGQFSINTPGFQRGRVAYLYSTESVSRLAEKNEAVTRAVSGALRTAIGQAGIPADQYLLEDILEDNFPEYDCYILPNVFAPSDRVRKAIDAKLKKKGKTLIFGYAPGAFSEKSGKINRQAMKELTGLDISFEMRSEPMAAVTVAGHCFGSNVPLGPFFSIDDPQAEVLARYQASGKTALAIKKQPDGWTSIVSLIPDLDYKTLGNLYERAGLLRLCDSGDPVYFDHRFFAIHASTAGQKKITFPAAVNVYDMFRKKCIGRMLKDLTLTMPRGQTRIFFLGAEAEWQRFLQFEKASKSTLRISE